MSSRPHSPPSPKAAWAQGIDMVNPHRKHNGHKSMQVLVSASTHLLSQGRRPLDLLLLPHLPLAGSARSQSLVNPNFRSSFASHSRIKIWPWICHPVIGFLPLYTNCPNVGSGFPIFWVKNANGFWDSPSWIAALCPSDDGMPARLNFHHTGS